MATKKRKRTRTKRTKRTKHWAIPGLVQIKSLLSSKNQWDRRFGRELKKDRASRIRMSVDELNDKFGK